MYYKNFSILLLILQSVLIIVFDVYSNIDLKHDGGWSHHSTKYIINKPEK